MGDEESSGGDKATAFVLAWACLFYRPLVVSSGWAWYVVPFGAPHVGYWTAMGLLTLWGTRNSARGAYSVVTKHDGEIAITTALSLATSHLIMWLAL